MFNSYMGGMYPQGGLSGMYDNPYLGGEENMMSMPQNTSQNYMPQNMLQNYMGQGYDMQAYAKGGAVRSGKKKPAIYSMAEKIRKKGKGEDTILAHINPTEARMLKSMGVAVQLILIQDYHSLDSLIIQENGLSQWQAEGLALL